MLGEEILEHGQKQMKEGGIYTGEEERFMLKGENVFCVTPELRLWISVPGIPKINTCKKFPPNKKYLVISKAACKVESM